MSRTEGSPMSNAIKTTVLLGLLTGLLLWIGQWIGGRQGLGIARVFGGAMHLGSYWFGDRFGLAFDGARAAARAGVSSRGAWTGDCTSLPATVPRDGREAASHRCRCLAMVSVAPICATLIRLAISRAREYQADASGPHSLHRPQELADALEKI